MHVRDGARTQDFEPARNVEAHYSAGLKDGRFVQSVHVPQPKNRCAIMRGEGSINWWGCSVFTIHDRIFLNRCGIAAGPIPTDGTAALLREYGIPQTWSNYLMLASGGQNVELDAEMESLLAPEEDEEDDE
jgi:hypothetical protein